MKTISRETLGLILGFCGVCMFGATLPMTFDLGIPAMTIGATELRVRRMMLDCRPEIRADMNTITPTPMATPTKMNTVCIRPSRKKRMATIHSNGTQGLNILRPDQG
jgi:hypothetical protein